MEKHWLTCNSIGIARYFHHQSHYHRSGKITPPSQNNLFSSPSSHHLQFQIQQHHQQWNVNLWSCLNDDSLKKWHLTQTQLISEKILNSSGTILQSYTFTLQVKSDQFHGHVAEVGCPGIFTVNSDWGVEVSPILPFLNFTAKQNKAVSQSEWSSVK